MKEKKWYLRAFYLSILIPIWFVLFILSFLFFIPKFFYTEPYTGKSLIELLTYIFIRLLWAMALSFVIAFIISIIIVFVISKTIQRWRVKR